MDDLDAALAEVTRGLADLTRQVGPEAAEATLKAVKVSGLINLSLGFIAVVVIVTLGWVCVTSVKKAMALDLKGENPVPLLIAAVVAGIVGFFCLPLPFIKLGDIRSWISAIDPAAGLAYRLLEKL